MQAFIILCIIGAAFAQGGQGKGPKGHAGGPGNGTGHHGHDISKIPGCENAEKVKDIKASTCCTTLPKVFDQDTWGNCSESCKKDDGKMKKYCCKANCVLKTLNIADASGKFDATKAKAELKTKAAAWPTDIIVDECVKNASETLKKMESFMPQKKNGTEEKCDNPENMVIIQCIRKGLITKCPDWVKSSECDNLLGFANSCPIYPMCDKPEKGEKDKADVKKSGKKEKKQA